MVELIRQFYDACRVFRISEPNGAYTFIPFSNESMQPVEIPSFMGVELGVREPIYDIKVSAQKQSPFNQISHNQFIMELFQNGFFNPALAEQAIAAIRLMEFEGKQKMLLDLAANRVTAAPDNTAEIPLEGTDDENQIYA